MPLTKRSLLRSNDGSTPLENYVKVPCFFGKYDAFKNGHFLKALINIRVKLNYSVNIFTIQYVQYNTKCRG